MISATHVVPHIGVEAAGPSYSVPRLCQALIDEGVDTVLHCLGDVPSRWTFPIEAHRQWPFPARLGISPEMLKALRKASESASIIHNHSLWMMPNIYPAWVIRNKTCRLITSPRGTLSPWAWARSRWVKKILWPWQKEVLFRANCFHATAENEYWQIREKGLNAPVAILPNGIDVPELYPSDIGYRMKEILFLGRIHPAKGIDLLLNVWAKIAPLRPEWKLRLVGPDNGGYLNQMENLRDSLNLKRVEFAGPVYGDKKTKAYQAADLFILPTHTENFGITVAEALANGIPAIVTKGAPWQGLESNGCGWWVDRDEDVLFEILQEAMSLSDGGRKAMGMRGRSWIQRDFSWDEIGRKMHLTYEWLLGGGPAPDWVRIK